MQMDTLPVEILSKIITTWRTLRTIKCVCRAWRRINVNVRLITKQCRQIRTGAEWAHEIAKDVYVRMVSDLQLMPLPISAHSIYDKCYPDDLQVDGKLYILSTTTVPKCAGKVCAFGAHETIQCGISKIILQKSLGSNPCGTVWSDREFDYMVLM